MGVLQNVIEHGDRFCAVLLSGRRRIIFIAVVFTAGVLSCGAVSVRLGEFNTWDLKNYQYYLPYALLTGRFSFDYAPAQIQSFLNPLPFVPFYAITTHLTPIAAGFVMGGIHGLAVGFLFLTALVLFSPLSPLPRLVLSLSCAALGAYGPTFLGMLGGSGSDNITAIFVLAGVYVLARGIAKLDASVTRKTLLMGGILIGIAAGLKLSCSIFLFGCAIAVLTTRWTWLSRLTATGLFSVASVLGVLISRGFWMAYLWSEYKSPLFPFFNTFFRSPYFHDKNFADLRYVPKTIASALLFPFHFISSTDFTRISHQFRDIRYALIYVLILLYVIVVAVKLLRARQRPLSAPSYPGRANIFLVVFFVTSYVAWQTRLAIMRYLVPLELLAPIVMVLLIRLVFSGKLQRSIVIVLTFLTVAAIMQPRRVPRRNWSSAYVHVETPKFEDPSATLVLIANNEPWSYVIPFFQPEVRFVGLWNSFSYLHKGAQHRYTDEMVAMVREHRGPIYLLSTAPIDPALKRLNGYKIYIVRAPATRLPINTDLQQAALSLWPVKVKR